MMQDYKRRIAKDKGILKKTIHECIKKNVEKEKVKRLCETYIDLLTNLYPNDEVRIIFEKHVNRLLKEESK